MTKHLGGGQASLPVKVEPHVPRPFVFSQGDMGEWCGWRHLTHAAPTSLRSSHPLFGQSWIFGAHSS